MLDGCERVRTGRLPKKRQEEKKKEGNESGEREKKFQWTTITSRGLTLVS